METKFRLMWGLNHIRMWSQEDIKNLKLQRHSSHYQMQSHDADGVEKAEQNYQNVLACCLARSSVCPEQPSRKCWCL